MMTTEEAVSTLRRKSSRWRIIRWLFLVYSGASIGVALYLNSEAFRAWALTLSVRGESAAPYVAIALLAAMAVVALVGGVVSLVWVGSHWNGHPETIVLLAMLEDQVERRRNANSET